MTSVVDDNFFTKLTQTIEEANKKQTLEIKKEIENLKAAIQEESKKRSELEVKYNLLKDKYARLDKSSRKNNIIIFGLDSTEEKLADYVINTLNTYLSLNLDYKDVNDVYAIGKQPSGKPIIVKLVSYLKKKEILQNCFKLKDVNKNRNNKINIAEELSPDEIRTQKVLRKHLNEARSRKIFAYIKGAKIYINGDAYTAEELEQKAVNSNEEEPEEEEVISILGSNSAPSTPTPVNNREVSESSNQTGHFSKKNKIATEASLIQTRTSNRKQEERNKTTGTQKKNKIGTNRSTNKEEENKNLEIL